MQQEIATLRAENRALSTELRKIAAQKKTPRERVSDADINRGFGQIRQELTELIALQNPLAPVDLPEN